MQVMYDSHTDPTQPRSANEVAKQNHVLGPNPETAEHYSDTTTKNAINHLVKIHYFHQNGEPQSDSAILGSSSFIPTPSVPSQGFCSTVTRSSNYIYIRFDDRPREDNSHFKVILASRICVGRCMPLPSLMLIPETTTNCSSVF